MICLTGMLSSAHAFEGTEVNVQWPLVAGQAGQNFSSNLGVDAEIYFDRILDPSVANFISIGYNSLTLNADATSSFRMIPLIAGIELQGKVWDGFYSTFGLGAGVSVAYISGTSTTTYAYTEYFIGQVKPGFEWDLGSGFAFIGRAPINFLVGKAEMTYMDFEAGIKIKFSSDDKPEDKTGDKSKDEKPRQQ